MTPSLLTPALRALPRFVVFFLFLLTALSATANDMDFDGWRSVVAREAIQRGIRPVTVHYALSNIQLDPDILEKDQKQPEKTISAETYWGRIVDPARIQKGKAFYASNRLLLNQIGETYGVQPRFIVALLGIESNYGETQGTNNIIQALATLAYDGRRSSYFKGELFEALRIIDQGHVSFEEMQGSWAGAMGWCQFMPSSFFKFAQDYDADGREDIWGSVGDAAASAANYLRMNGWKRGEGWGRRVKVTEAIPEEWGGLKVSKTINEWGKLGVRQTNGKKLTGGNMQASLIQPDGPEGTSFLVYNNFNVIMSWNRSTYFATAVGMIADKLGN